jgi:hypothetical protein
MLIASITECLGTKALVADAVLPCIRIQIAVRAQVCRLYRKR